MGTAAKWVTGVVGVALAAGMVFWRVSHEEGLKAKRGYAVQQLRDPGSVQFRNERMTDAGWLCGEMNSKNAYGAYTGFSRFMSHDDEDVWVEGSGYVGKARKGNGAYDLSIEMSDARAEFVKLLKLGREVLGKADADLPPASKIEEGASRHLFAQKWAKHCA